MKKIIIALAAIAAAFTMTSCNKEQLVEPEKNTTPTKGNSIITASIESSLTKTSLDGNDTDEYKVVWSDGDTFKIGDNTFTLIEGAGTSTGKFQGTLPEGDGPFYAYYPAEYNGTDWPTTQVYTAGNITGSPMKAEVVKGAESLSFKNVGGILRLKVKGSEDILIANITVSANGLENITLNCGDGVALDATDGTVFHIAMPEESYSGTSILFTTVDGKSCTKTMKTGTQLDIERSKITPASFTVGNFKTLAPEGALPELFTVSANGKKVFFSKGNLWCDTDTNPASDNFHFEDNQYDTTPAKDTDRSISHISHFMWCRSAADAVKASYSETSKSTDDILFTNAAGFTVNGLENWYAPSLDEMNYLLEKRKASTVGSTVNARYFFGRIDKGSENYVRGMFLIPDVFTWPLESHTAPSDINIWNANYDVNTYSVSEFAILQQEGVVFLPCAGNRDGYFGYSNVYYVNTSGYYWSSTLKDADNARHFGVSNSGSGAIYSNERGKAFSIRLVTDLSDNTTPSFTVSFDMNGHGTAPADINGVQYRSTIAKPSNPTATGFAFAGWYKDLGCTVKWDFDSNVVTANTTLYAGWIELPDGALSGQFTVNASGEQIVFSRGNVWYGTLDYDGPVYNIPYGYYFEAGQCVSVPSVFSGQNLYTRDKYHVSHFYWTKEAFYSYHGYTPYQDNYGEYTTSPTDILFTDQSDFTVNEQKGLWRALTKEECDYLLNQRQMLDNTRVRYENCCDGINVYGSTFKGIFLYPDDYNGPLMGADGVPSGWKWSDISAAGIVFLPAGGYRSGTTVYNNGYAGEYLLNSPESSDAYALTFSRDNGPAVSSRSRTRGCSIRLVMDLSGSPAPYYTVNFDLNGKTGTAPESIRDILRGSKITKPSVPVTNGYEVSGWYKDAACTQAWDFDSDVVTSNITLYANWTRFGEGYAEVKAEAGISGNKVKWIQLWQDGPKFAEYNVGANSPEEYGGYYCWGGTVSKDGTSYFEYERDLAGKYDTATNLWGDNWRMPREKEIENLISKCEYKWTEQNNVYGALFIGKDAYSSNSLFLPAAGYYDTQSKDVENNSKNGLYWTSNPEVRGRAYYMLFNLNRSQESSYGIDQCLSVRAVLAEQ